MLVRNKLTNNVYNWPDNENALLRLKRDVTLEQYEGETSQGYDGLTYVKGKEPVKPAAQIISEEIIELSRKLDASDYVVIKIAEGAATVDEYADLIEQRAQWRARINELEAIIE